MAQKDVEQITKSYLEKKEEAEGLAADLEECIESANAHKDMLHTAAADVVELEVSGD